MPDFEEFSNKNDAQNEAHSRATKSLSDAGYDAVESYGAVQNGTGKKAPWIMEFVLTAPFDSLSPEDQQVLSGARITIQEGTNVEQQPQQGQQPEPQQAPEQAPQQPAEQPAPQDDASADARALMSEPAKREPFLAREDELEGPAGRKVKAAIYVGAGRRGEYEANGIARPRAGTDARLIWNATDRIAKAKGRIPFAEEVRAEMLTHGFEASQVNAVWKRYLTFFGISQDEVEQAKGTLDEQGKAELQSLVDKEAQMKQALKDARKAATAAERLIGKTERRNIRREMTPEQRRKYEEKQLEREAKRAEELRKRVEERLNESPEVAAERERAEAEKLRARAEARKAKQQARIEEYRKREQEARAELDRRRAEAEKAKTDNAGEGTESAGSATETAPENQVNA